jgi:PAS domain S-box-containing protein
MKSDLVDASSLTSKREPWSLHMRPVGTRRDRSQLQQIVAGVSEGIIIIDPDRTIVWANDAALAMHGADKLADLGKNAEAYRKRFRLRYRNNHPLGHGEYPIERLISGEHFDDVTVHVTRVRKQDQAWVHRIRSLVITERSGEPDCFILIISDVTEQYEAEKRFEAAFHANPAPAIVCRLADLRYVKVNQGFIEMTGYPSEKIIGRSINDIDILADAEQRQLALERLEEGRTIPQMEAHVPLPGRAQKFVIVAGQPIEMDDENCMLFTFADIDSRKKAETALRQSEERFATSFRLAPVPVTIANLAGFKILEVNEAFRQITGYTEDQVIGRSATEIHLWVDRAAQQQFERALEETGSIRNLDLQMKAKDGTLLDCLVSSEIVEINDQRCVLCVMLDITERKRSEEELIEAIEAVMQDTSWFSRTIVEKLAALRQSSRASRSTAALDDLTDREREILGLICQGMTDAQMSATLSLSKNTVRNHVASLYHKLGVNRRGAVIIWGRERGIVRSGIVKKKRREK